MFRRLGSRPLIVSLIVSLIVWWVLIVAGYLGLWAILFLQSENDDNIYITKLL